MSWFLLKENNHFYAVEEDADNRLGPVTSLKAHRKEFCMIQIFVDEDLVKDLDIRKFNCSGSEESAHFKGHTLSRSQFVKTWKKMQEMTISTDEEPEGITMDDSADTENEEAPVENISDKETDEDDIDTNVRSDDMAEQKLIGESIEVHIENLVSPSKDRMVRVVDYSHVAFLEKSFQAGYAQIHLLIGVVGLDINLKNLIKPGVAKVQVIGGNHTRLALQSLHSKGLLNNPLVKLNLYSQLTLTECLSVGVKHNEVLLSSKEMTFIDKVKLIRSRKPKEDDLVEPGAEHLRKWKKELMVIFSKKKLREVSHNMKNHLRLSRSSEEVWAKVMEVDEKWMAGEVKAQPKKQRTITQTFFIKLLMLEEDEEKIELLDCLLTDGYRAFINSVNEALARQKNGINSTKQKNGKQNCHSDLEGENTSALQPDEQIEDDVQAVTEEDDWKKKCGQLMEENEILKTENERLQEELIQLKKQMDRDAQKEKKIPEKTETSQSKKRKPSENVEFQEGEEVEALWKDSLGQGWYNATIKKIKPNGQYIVRYEDGVVKTVAPSWIRTSNNN